MNFWNRLHPKIAFFCRLLTQTATSRPKHTIFTSSVNAILKARTDMFFGTKFGVVQNFFFLRWEAFITTETTLPVTGYSLSYLNNHDAVVEQPRVQKSTLGRLGYLQTFWQHSESLPIFVPLAWSSILLGTTEESYKKSLIRETLNLLVVALTVVALTKLVITNTH